MLGADAATPATVFLFGCTGLDPFDAPGVLVAPMPTIRMTCVTHLLVAFASSRHLNGTYMATYTPRVISAVNRRSIPNGDGKRGRRKRPRTSSREGKRSDAGRRRRTGRSRNDSSSMAPDALNELRLEERAEAAEERDALRVCRCAVVDECPADA